MSSRMRLVLVGAAALAVCVVATVVVLLARGGSGAAPQLSVPPAVQRFPAPPAGAYVRARADGGNVLAVALLPQGGRLSLQVSEIDLEGAGVRHLGVSFAVTSSHRTRTRTATTCGSGCYRATVALGGRPTRLRVRIAHPTRTTVWDVALPARWPPADARAILARADRVFRTLHSLRFSEHLASDPEHAVDSTWQVVAPDRLAYQIAGQGQAVIVGPQRWDRQQGGTWTRSSSSRLRQPQPGWVAVRNAHVVAAGRLRGHRVWRISFFDPRTPGWFLVAVDRTSYRTLDVQMTAAAHFMHDAYGSFNTSLKIEPPVSR